jgi:recombination protein RecA
LKFYASIRCEVKKLTGAENKFYNDDKDLIGHAVSINVVKNKMAAPYRKAEFSVYYQSGIDTTSEIAAVAVKKGIVTIDGNTYSYKDKKIAVGEAKYRAEVLTNEKLRAILLRRLFGQATQEVEVFGAEAKAA